MPTVRKRRASKQKTGRTKQSRRQQDKLKKIIVRGPPALVKEWDTKLTAAQNYERMGLHLRRPMALRNSGGVEKLHPPVASTSQQTMEESDSDSSDDQGDQDMDQVSQNLQDGAETEAALEPPTTKSRDVPKGFARIERDAEGNVLRVVMSAWDSDGEEDDNEEQDNEADETETPWGAPLNDEKEEQRVKSIAQPIAAKSKAIRDLEQQSRSERSTPAAALRFTSPAERVFLTSLYAKYATDVEAMARDIKLNRDQRTAGQLKRMFAKAGGFEAFALAQAS